MTSLVLAWLIAWATLQPAPQAASAPASSITVPAHVDFTIAEKVYNDAIIKDGTIERVSKQLEGMCADAARPKRTRANACLLRSHLEWRHGRMAPAMAAVDAGLAVDAYDEIIYHKARLLDASGKMDDTRQWYQKALDATTNPALKETIRLRLTFVDAVGQNVASLVALAKTRPVEFRNRAAIALALLGFDKDAAELYTVQGEGSELYREHIRVAQWAIKAKNAAKAKDESWQAVQHATLERDRNYALSLLVEAHGIDQTIPALIDRLGQQKTLTLEEQRVRIDLLRQTGQYQKAIDLFTSAYGQSLDPELRLELLRMYRDAGQDAAMVTEYQRLIAGDPARTEWVDGLSQYYLEKGDQPAARKLWEEFIARNREVNPLLVASESLTSFGMHDLAIAAANKALAGAPSLEDGARVRLAQFDLYRRRGANVEAEGALKALDAALPAGSPYRAELADAYERIQKPQLAATTLEGLEHSPTGLNVDDRMRLAWLFDSTGRRDDALKLWRSIWDSESVEARRKLVQERMLMLAAETGTLGDLAVELEEKVKKGTAAPKDVSLLVSIYTKVGDSVSAIETITTASARGGQNAKTEVESLKEQSQIYLAMAEYPDFTRVMRRLIEVDPDNKVDYLQALLLNQIEASNDASRETPDGTAQLREWLAQLRKVGGDAVGSEFEAGVLDLAGFRDQALESYRRALAMHPERADDYLLLADILRQAGRQVEAETSLQYLAESAEGDELFLVAIDGITNMQTGNAATIKWAQRRALERLTSQDDKLYLYEMLGELAEEARDPNAYIAALEGSLAHADSRRSYVLRELLAVTAEVTINDGSQRVIGPDPNKNVAYARRLIALGEEMPPEVYVDLGRTFIRLNDPASARRAFSLAVDRTGRTSVVFEAGKLFERGGFDKDAISQYEHALIADSENLEAMVRLARAREREGAIETANDLYGRALLSIVMRQVHSVERGQERVPPAIDGLATFDYRRFYQPLVAGFLSTLPAGRDAQAARMKVLEDAFTRELADVQQAPAASRAPLAYYPRLVILTSTVRAASFATGVTGPADRVAAALASAFPSDPSVASLEQDDRRRWGMPAESTPPPSSSTAPRQTAQPTPPASAVPLADRPPESIDFIKEIGAVLAAGDQDAALPLYRQWAKFAGSPKPPMMIGAVQIADRSAGIPEVATHALQRLDQRHFDSFAQYVFGLVTDQDTYAERAIQYPMYQYEVPDVPILNRLEASIGQPLIAEDRLLRFLSKPGAWDNLNLEYVVSHLSPSRQIDVLDRYFKSTDMYWSMYLRLVGIALAKPQDEAGGARFVALLKNNVQTGMKRGSGVQLLPNFFNYVFTTGVAASNAYIIEELEKSIAEKYPQQFRIGYFRAALLRDVGRDQEALAQFVDTALAAYVPLPTAGTIITAGTPSPYSYQSYVRSFGAFIFPKYRADVLKLLEEREAGPAGLTPALISLRVELNNSDPSADQRQFAAGLQALADRHPENEQVRMMLYPIYDQIGDTLKATDVLGDLVRLKPDNRDYKYRLALLWQKLEYPENVAKVTGGKPIQDLIPAPPPRPNVISSGIIVSSMSGPPAQRFPMLKRAVDAVKAASSGGDPQASAAGLRTILQTLPPGGMSLSEYSQVRDPEDPYLYLRDFLTMDGAAPPKPPASATSPGAPSATPPAPPPPPVAVSSGGVVTTIIQTSSGLVTVMSSSPLSGGAPPLSAGPVGSNPYERLVTSLLLTSNEPASSQNPIPKMPEFVGRYAFSIEPLEAYVRSMKTTDIDRQYPFFTMLVDAYISGGRGESELNARTPLLISRQLSQKDLAIWLGLAAKQPKERAAELVAAAEQGSVAEVASSGLARLFLARLYVQAGMLDKAATAYVNVVTGVLAGTNNTLQLNSIVDTDPYGRDNGLWQFTGLTLFDEARRNLDADGLNRFVSEMLTVSRPATSPAIQVAYTKFVNVLFVKASRLGLKIPALDREAGPLPLQSMMTRPETLQAAFVRARLGRTDEALDILKTVIQRDFDARVVISAAQSNALYAARQYQVALGLTGDVQMIGPFGLTGSGIEEMKPLFPATETEWPGGVAWVSRVATEVPKWIAQGAVNRDAGMQVLCLVSLRLQQLGDTAGAQAAARDLSTALAKGPVSLKATALTAMVGDKVGAPIALSLLQEQVRANRLPIKLVVGIITRTAEAESPAAALKLGDVAASFTSNDDLIHQLVTIAKASGDNAAIDKWNTRQQEIATAKALLTKR